MKKKTDETLRHLAEYAAFKSAIVSFIADLRKTAHADEVKAKQTRKHNETKYWFMMGSAIRLKNVADILEQMISILENRL